jgi:hypothetical protein
MMHRTSVKSRTFNGHSSASTNPSPWPTSFNFSNPLTNANGSTTALSSFNTSTTTDPTSWRERFKTQCLARIKSSRSDQFARRRGIGGASPQQQQQKTVFFEQEEGAGMMGDVSISMTTMDIMSEPVHNNNIMDGTGTISGTIATAISSGTPGASIQPPSLPSISSPTETLWLHSMIADEWGQFTGAGGTSIPLDPDEAAKLEAEIRMEMIKADPDFGSLASGMRNLNAFAAPWMPVQNDSTMDEPTVQQMQFAEYQAQEAREMNEMIRTHLGPDLNGPLDGGMNGMGMGANLGGRVYESSLNEFAMGAGGDVLDAETDNWEPVIEEEDFDMLMLAEATAMQSGNLQQQVHVCPACQTGHLLGHGKLIGCTKCPLRLKFHVSCDCLRNRNVCVLVLKHLLHLLQYQQETSVQDLISVIVTLCRNHS